MRILTWLSIAVGTLCAVGTGCDSDSPTSKGGGSASTPDDDEDDDSAPADDDESSSSAGPDAGRGKADASRPLDAGKQPGASEASVQSGQDSSAPGAKPDAKAPDARVAPLDASGSAPASGTFPTVTDTGAAGPFTPKTVNNTGPQGGYTLYHPEELAPDGALNPIVAWGNGGLTTPDWYPMLPHLASHGFVVIASNNSLVTGDDVRAGLDWIIEQNEEASSDFYQKLDTDNVSGVGYSNGGLATYGIADDKRLVTIVIISGANTTADSRAANMPKLHTPIAYLCTDDDASQGNCASDYGVVEVPAFFGVLNGTEHVSVVFDDAAIDRLSAATTAWLRWQQMNDQSLKDTFVGDDCGLCKDSAWTVEPQKNLQ